MWTHVYTTHAYTYAHALVCMRVRMRVCLLLRRVLMWLCRWLLLVVVSVMMVVVVLVVVVTVYEYINILHNVCVCCITNLASIKLEMKIKRKRS